MTSLQKRFSKKFSHSLACGLATGIHYKTCTCEIKEILAFIEEEKTESGTKGLHDGYQMGKKEESQRITSLIGRFLGEYANGSKRPSEIRQMFDDLLSKIRGEERINQGINDKQRTYWRDVSRSGIQEETECCENGKLGTIHFCQKELQFPQETKTYLNGHFPETCPKCFLTGCNVPSN